MCITTFYSAAQCTLNFLNGNPVERPVCNSSIALNIFVHFVKSNVVRRVANIEGVDQGVHFTPSLTEHEALSYVKQI